MAAAGHTYLRTVDNTIPSVVMRTIISIGGPGDHTPCVLSIDPVVMYTMGHTVSGPGRQHDGSHHTSDVLTRSIHPPDPIGDMIPESPQMI